MDILSHYTKFYLRMEQQSFYQNQLLMAWEIIYEYLSYFIYLINSLNFLNNTVFPPSILFLLILNSIAILLVI